MSRFDRVAWASLGAGALTVLGLSRWLTPSPTGVGTHMQLGLPPCGFLALFGLPCPACGLTTAFAHLAHLNVMASLRANPVGVPLFAITLLLVPLSVAQLVRGRPIAALFAVPRIEWLALAIALALLATWVVRLLFAVVLVR